MEDSILTSTKKILGLGESDTTFDLDIITHINSMLSILSQLGIPPQGTFYITGVDDNWSDMGLPQDQLGMVRTYAFLKVRMLFDPPSTSFNIEAMNKQIEEHEVRLSWLREAAINEVVVPIDTNDIDAASGTQTTPALVWTMTHNLGFNPAGLRFTTLDGVDELEPSEIQYVSINQTLAIWPSPTAGKWNAS